MEYREDITNFIRERFTDEHYKTDEYKVFEQDGIFQNTSLNCPLRLLQHQARLL